MSQSIIDYDKRYRANYMADFADLAEADRMLSVSKSIRCWLAGQDDGKILDYGCGQGRYFPVWRDLFPNAELFGAEISDVAIDLIEKNFADMKGRVFKIDSGRATSVEDGCFDLIFSIEVMEHIERLQDYLEDIFRLLREGGRFVWTTPCANALSLEWLAGMISGGIQSTNEGFRRYRWEDPAHLRRLKTRELTQMLEKLGYKNIRYHFRSHFFGTIAYQMWSRLGRKRKLARLLGPVAHTDYCLFRRVPNAASMIGIAEKKR